MRCPVCNSTDKWQNVDSLRLKPHDMCMCMGCGFVSYPENVKSPEQMKEYYRTQYRKAPNITHIWTGQQKLHYHQAFLGDLFDQWRNEKRMTPVIGEVGAAFGMLLHWIRKHHFPKAEFIGTELGVGNRMVAKHEYNIDLVEELDLSKSYDLLINYHVLEHMSDPDTQLRVYREIIKPDGFLYLATPIWFREAGNFGMEGFDIEYYWHPDHINCWSEQHLEHIFSTNGLSIVQKNTTMYCNTYLLKKDEKKTVTVNWEPEKLLEKARGIRACWEHMQSNETQQAVDAYPNCPLAWVQHYEMIRSKIHQADGFFAVLSFINAMFAACPNSAEAYIAAADLASRYDECQMAMSYFERALEMKPNNPKVLIGISNLYRQQWQNERDPEMRVKYLKEAIRAVRHLRETCSQMYNDATSWLFRDISLLPMGDKNAVAQSIPLQLATEGSSGTGVHVDAQPDTESADATKSGDEGGTGRVEGSSEGDDESDIAIRETASGTYGNPQTNSL